MILDNWLHTPFQDVRLSDKALKEIRTMPGRYDLANRFVSSCFANGFIVKLIKTTEPNR